MLDKCVTESIVEIQGLSRKFGAMRALDEINLTVEPGLVYGLVGSNGAGKSTLIKHILGLMRAQQGTVRTFGLDPVRHPVEVLGEIGYLSEDRDLPDWMRIHELLNYTSAFYPRWDQDYAEELLRTFDLDPRKKVKNLSKGMRAQAGLIVAVAHRPRLLLLDEPSTGLDAVVRKDILNAIVRAVADDGRTVVFSSHLLDEVEQMSDRVFMIDRGRLALEGSVDEIRAGHFVVDVRLHSATPIVPQTLGVLSTEVVGSQCRLVSMAQEESTETMRATMESRGYEVLHLRNATLQEVFVARVGRNRSQVVGAVQ